MPELKPNCSNATSRLPILALRTDSGLWAAEFEAGLHEEEQAEKQ
jgi:hypothetical protein